MSIVIIWYVNYILPNQKENQEKFDKIQEQKNLRKEQYEKRQAQIKLSQKLNSKVREKNASK
jgi:coenzyme F420-reducing hydrogenase beta subunit